VVSLPNPLFQNSHSREILLRQLADQNDIKSVQNDIKFLLAMMGRFTIDENGTLTVKKVVTEDLELGGYCVKVVEGKLSAEKGSCK